ncbi:plasma membrane ascorbate-dependent reductase CYBRD1-like isoform X2 [Ornithodoros turicata]|uniref:plasma membrane ascorbate-dependent reductase CYBRD1-like isoform X2 n=1 Tax=Ornithodoros turicata TaxID=34597 RepID=UPI0031393BCD
MEALRDEIPLVHVLRADFLAKQNHQQQQQHASGGDGQREEGGGCGSHTAMKALFYFLLFLAEVLLFGTITLTIYWVLNYEGGVKWANDIKRQFNLHYILMVGGFIFLNGQAILVYRSFTCCKKIYNKVLHTIFFVLSISSITIGIVSAFQAHNSVADPKHFYSLHSWIGLGTMGLFALQFVVGFTSFLVLLCCDKATLSYRQRLVPIHTNFGLIIFGMAAAACVTGLMQTAKGRYSGKEGAPNYRELPEQAIFVNTIAAAIIALTILLPLLVRNNLRGGQTVLSIN